MRLGVLGSLTLDGTSDFGRRDRAVLTALAIYVGRSLSADQLADAVWGADLPPSSHKALQGCVVRLRKALGTDAIGTSAQGYRLNMAADEIDSHRFEQMVVRSRELLTLGEPERAAFRLTEALELWRGRAFEDVESWDSAIIEAGRLDELRLEAEELRVDAFLRTGRHQDVLAVADSMVKAAPLRERRWTLLAWAQYQAGRQTEALRTIQRVKSLLADKLGLDPGPGLATLEEAILRQDDSLLAESRPALSPTCPYQGLTPYDVDDAELFFGRDPDLIVCLDILKRLGSLTVIGPSGCGKSSLVRAGIAAALRRDGNAVAIMTPGEHPMQALTALPNSVRRSALLVDQCEEVFSLCSDEAERDAFLSSLVAFAEHGSLVMALRADRLAEVAAHPSFARLVERSLHLLGGMSEHELREAVESPARQAGLLIEPGLVDLLVGEVEGTPGALPLLSHALLETWKRREGYTLTVAGYVATGGIRGAVAQSAEHVYSSLEPGQRHALRDLVLRLVTSGSEGEPVRSPVPRRLLSADKQHEHLIDLLVTSRLVTSDADVVEIAHEALARAWPRLRAWLDDDVEGQRIMHHLSGAADAWNSMGRPDSELYRGARLSQALEWWARNDTTLTGTEVAFLEAAEATEESEQRAAEVRARSQARLIRRLRGVLVGAALLLVVALVAGALAVHQADRADTNAATAEAHATAAESNALAADARRVGAKALATDDIDTSMLLAVAGVRLDDSSATRANLLATLAQRPQLFRSTPYDGDVITGLEVSPDGRSVAVYDRTSGLGLFDTRTWKTLASIDRQDDRVPHRWLSPMAFSPDGATLAVGMPALAKRPIRLLDARTLDELPAQLPDAPRQPSRVVDIGFSADGSAVAANFQLFDRAGGYWTQVNSEVLVWDLDDPDRPQVQLRTHLASDPWFGYRSMVALSHDGGTLYTSTPLSAYDVGSGRKIYSRSDVFDTTGVPDPTSNFFELNPQGTLLALTQIPDRLLLIDASSGKVRRELHGHSEEVRALRFSHDGTLLVSSSSDRTAIIWEVATGEVSERIRLGEDANQALAFSPDDATLYTAGGDRAVRAWDLEGSRRFLKVAAAPRDYRVGSVIPSPGGRFLMGWLGDGHALRFYDLAAQQWTPWVGKQQPKLGVTWNSRGDQVASVGVDLIQLWDPETATVVSEATLNGTYAAADFSPDDSRIAILNAAGRVSMLDAESLKPVGRSVQLDGTGGAISLGPSNRALILTPGYVPDSTFEHFSRGWTVADLDSGQVVNQGEVTFDAGWLASSPVGGHAAIIGTAGEVIVLDVESGEPVGPQVVGHNAGGWGMDYSPDGSRIFTTGLDGGVSLWDGTSGELLGTVVLPEQTVVNAAFGEDGHTVVMSTDYESVYIWDTRVEYALDYACRLAGRDFTRAEWRENFGERAYEETCPAV